MMNSKYNLAILLVSVLFLSACKTTQESSSQSKQQPPNVLFIAVDDLKDWVGVLEGHPQVQTPNIDKFCKDGSIIFKNAVCAAPMCGPSRSALLSGYMPTTTGIYDNGTNMLWSSMVQENATLPEYFSKNGYHTLSTGKIFHKHYTEHGRDEGHWAIDEHQEKIPPTKVKHKQLYSHLKNIVNGEVMGEPFQKKPAGHISWGPTKETFEETMDYVSADWAKQQLQRDFDKPFFMAVGFTRPHLPWFAPQEFYDKYDLETIQVPPILEGDLDDIVNKKGQPIFKASDEYKWIKKNGLEKEVTRAYLANVTYVDACLGVLFDAFENSKYAENTIVVLWSDHGYHVGEKMRFKKNTFWKEVTTMPFMVRMPDTKGMTYSDRTVSLLDLSPPLIELCGLPKKELDGHDFSPLLKNPNQKWQYPGITSTKSGTSVITEDWHFVQHKRGAMELYDLKNDPNEWNNLANDAKYAEKVAELKAWLPANPVKPLPKQGNKEKNKKNKKLMDMTIKATRDLNALK